MDNRDDTAIAVSAVYRHVDKARGELKSCVETLKGLAAELGDEAAASTPEDVVGLRLLAIEVSNAATRLGLVTLAVRDVGARLGFAANVVEVTP